MRITNAVAASLVVATKYVTWIGDSITEGVSNPVGLHPGYRGDWWRIMRQRGDDWRAVGAFLVSPAPGAGSTLRYSPGDPRHEGVSGQTIEVMTARIAADFAAFSSLPDVVYILAGTNNVSTDTPAAMWIKALALVDAVRTAAPRATIVCCTIPLVPLFAATRAAFNAGLSANVVALRDAGVVFLDTCSDFTNADQGRTGGGATVDPHPSDRGYNRIARRMADFATARYPVPTGPTNPRVMSPRVAQSAIKCPGASDAVRILTGAAFNLQAPTRFVLGFDFAPTGIVGVLGIIGYDVLYSSGGMLVAQNAAGISVYYGSGGPKIASFGVLATGKRARYWVHYDEVALILSLWGTPANATQFPAPAVLLGVQTGFTPGTFAATIAGLLIGTQSGVGPAIGQVSNVEYGTGSLVPTFDNLRPFIEANWFEAAALPGATGLIRFDEGSGTAPADSIGTAPVAFGQVATTVFTSPGTNTVAWDSTVTNLWDG